MDFNEICEIRGWMQLRDTNDKFEKYYLKFHELLDKFQFFLTSKFDEKLFAYSRNKNFLLVLKSPQAATFEINNFVI